jgi:hypothetical protein
MVSGRSASESTVGLVGRDQASALDVHGRLESSLAHAPAEGEVER